MDPKSSRIFKVIVQFQEKDEVFYTRIKTINGGPTKSLQNIICERYPSLSSLIQRCFVKDKSGGEFSIITTDDLEVFLEGAEFFENVVRVEINGVTRDAPTANPESPPKRVRIDDQMQSTPTKPVVSPMDPNEPIKAVHENVVCDCCDETIVGFRYKCTECFNYDLCMTCENKMRHREHVMLRIPCPSVTTGQSPYRAAKWAFKKAAREAARETAQANEGEHDKSSRRHHHHGKRHQRRCQRQGPFEGFFRHLAEDSAISDGDVETSAQEASQAWASTAGAAPGGQQQEQQQQQEQSTPRAAHPIPPMYDFHKLVKVVETVAGNVSKLFDPYGVSLDSYVNYGVNVPPTTTPSAAAPASSSDSNASKQPAAAASGTKEKQATEPAMETTIQGQNTNEKKEAEAMLVKDSAVTFSASTSETVPEPVIMDIVDESTTDSVIIQPTTDAIPMPSPSASHNSDDAEWLVISNEGMPETSLEQDKATQVTPRKEPTASTSAQTSASASMTTTSAQTQDYTELAHNLQKHIEEQLKIDSKSSASSQSGSSSNVARVASAPVPIVYHPVPHINMSIQRMMDMGFSNDGGCLTELMACCNGDIRRALDSLLYKK